MSRPYIVLITGVMLAAAGGGPGSAAAQEQRASMPTTAREVATAFRAEPRAPNVDGRLDDPVWERATPITEFTQRDPHEGEPGSERTEVRILYTDAAIYFGIRAWDSRAEAIAAKLTRRDVTSPSDWIGVVIDSYYDRRTAFGFFVNPAGVKRDIYFYDDTNEDDSWDAVWNVAVTRDSAGWSAEFEIPFSQLRFSAAARHVWGLNVYRKINRLNEEQYWRLLPKNESGVVSRFGDLVGIEGVSPPRRIEILPYVVASQQVSPSVAGNPFASGRARAATIGGDINVGISSNLTLNATINPDFGQIEADPAVVNLSAFETFFPEKRPFFLEGLDIFQFSGGSSLFYTRRIGRAPQGSADPRGGYAERISNSTILGAAKVTGKTPDGWTIGLLGAVTDQEEASVIDAGGVPFTDVVEPRTGYMVGRLARDLRNGQTQLGLLGTAVARDLPDGGGLEFLRTSAFVGATNWSHRFRNDTYRLSGWAAASHVRGAPLAIELTQRSPARYFQRPDADHVDLDPTRTSLSGFAGALSFGKHGGGTWRFETGVNTRSPGFESNDAGFQQSADYAEQWLWVQRRWTQPGNVFRRFFVNLNQWAVVNYDGERTGTGGNLNANFTLLNYWGGWFGGNVNAAHLATGATRGGPGIIRPRSINGWLGFETDSRRAVRGALEGWYFQQNAAETRSGGLWSNLSVRPAANMDLSVSPNIHWTRDDWQYLQTSDALGETHYVFGDLQQTTVAMQFRGNVTFTPSLSLQLYAEPFMSAGQYLEFKRVADPRGATYADRFTTYDADQLLVADDEVSVDVDRDGTAEFAIGNPDFRFLSFRSNVVARWEYLPGSTLFVVWQHGRTGFSRAGRFDFSGGLGDLFDAAAENTVLVKLNYWFSL